jgi:hypothetical protein
MEDSIDILIKRTGLNCVNLSIVQRHFTFLISTAQLVKKIVRLIVELSQTSNLKSPDNEIYFVLKKQEQNRL